LASEIVPRSGRDLLRYGSGAGWSQVARRLRLVVPGSRWECSAGGGPAPCSPRGGTGARRVRTRRECQRSRSIGAASWPSPWECVRRRERARVPFRPLAIQREWERPSRHAPESRRERGTNGLEISISTRDGTTRSCPSRCAWSASSSAVPRSLPRASSVSPEPRLPSCARRTSGRRKSKPILKCQAPIAQPDPS
jgi:hypothetical protein